MCIRDRSTHISILRSSHGGTRRLTACLLEGKLLQPPYPWTVHLLPACSLPDEPILILALMGAPRGRAGEYRALTADHADCGTWGKPIGWNPILSRRIHHGEVGIRQTACGSSRADDAQRRRDRRAL